MKNSVDISVIIPVYNASALIRRCLDSILAQKGDYVYEVLLVDDGSTDDSVAVIESYNNPCFKVFRQQNAGPAAARNRGIREAKGRFLTFIDADDFWIDDFFSETISFLQKHEECIAVSTGQKHLTLGEEIIRPTCVGLYEKAVVIDDFLDYWATWTHVCTGSMVARTEVIKSTGGMRTDLRFTEDWELWILLALKGKWGFIPRVLLVCDGGTVTVANGWLKKMEVRWKNAPTIEVWQKRIVNLATDVVNQNSYKKVQGVVSRDLTYSMLIGGKIKESRQEAILYGKYFIKDPLGRLMNLCKHFAPLWYIMAKALKYREYHRNL